MANLTEQILGGAKSEAVIEQPETLATTVLSTPNTELPRKLKLKAEASQRMNELHAFGQGMRSILNTAATGIGYLDKTINPQNAPLYNKLQNDISEQNKSFKETNPPSEGILPTAPEVAYIAGQTVATAPLVPMRAIQGIRGVLGALPTISSTGEKIAAPFVNKLAASTVTGGATGAEFGALTSSSNDESLLENTGKGLITGALAGPLLTTTASVGKNIYPAAKSLWANVRVGKIARESGLEPSAVKKIIEYLENAGLSPQQAQLELNKLGPQATLGDLSSSLQARVGGLATFDPKAMEIVKGRYEARAKTANSEAHQILESKLGPKPNLDAEREAIIKKVQKDVAPDYRAAHASSDVLDIKSVVDDIDKSLVSAVGPKAQALKTIKGYLFNKTKDAEGNTILSLKDSVEHLHEVRMAIDDVIDKAKNPQSSIGKRALAAVQDVRDKIDIQLKTNPEMAAADAKFADKMQILKDIDTGENLLKGNGTNKEEFAKFYNSLSPERQAAIAKGMHGNIGDLMEGATRGELSEAQRLFGKSSRNRANVEKVFGNRGTEVLDALQKQATMRGTENSIIKRSLTAEGQAVQREFGERNDGGGGLSFIHGAALDLATGSGGGATALSAIGRFGRSIKANITGNRQERLIQGTADLLSRQGAERDIGLDVVNRANAVQNSIKSKSKFNFDFVAKSPTYLLSAPAGELGYSSYKKLGRE